ncbi:MAG: metallophosphoesterase [Clostridia bacterium]|nr:metallophosphoesterase [Clostridia bacterium]
MLKCSARTGRARRGMLAIIGAAALAWAAFAMTLVGPTAASRAAAGPAVFTFAVVGDSQGRNQVWDAAVNAMNSSRSELVLHCGDMTAFGTRDQYQDFVDRANRLRMPWYPVPGNHDVRTSGTLFTLMTGKKSYYSFIEKGYRFVGLDDSAGFIDSAQMNWLSSELRTKGRKFVFMHIPLYDPIPGGDHCLSDTAQAAELSRLFSENEVLAVFSGHVHIYNSRESGGVLYVTTGGAGASLYAPPDQGGFYHYTLVQVDGGKVRAEAKRINVVLDEPRVSVIGNGRKREFGLGELAAMQSIEVNAAFQNQFGNLRDGAAYTGVNVAKLIEAVGGMNPGQTLRVTCDDGYAQDFAFENVHVQGKWAELQGPMLLAFEKNGVAPPEWMDGPRLVLAAPDGVYSNDDCSRTSMPGQGWNVYKSAGARWARRVARIEIKAK